MDNLTKRTEPRFRSLLGKRCRVKDADGKWRFGTLDFAGTNEFFNKPWATLSRCPIPNADLDTLEEVTNGQTNRLT